VALAIAGLIGLGIWMADRLRQKRLEPAATD
jgi:hypothetical protein